MKIKAFTLFLFTALLFAGCSDDDDKKSNNCEEEGFGFFKLNIPSSEYRTDVLYTDVTDNSISGSQLIPANKTSGTVEIPDGTYTIAVSWVDENDEAVTDAIILQNVVIETCETTTRTVTFEAKQSSVKIN